MANANGMSDTLNAACDLMVALEKASAAEIRQALEHARRQAWSDHVPSSARVTWENIADALQNEFRRF